MKKRILMMLLTLGLVASLTGCAGEEKATLKNQEETVEKSVEEDEEKAEGDAKEETDSEEVVEEATEETNKKSGAVLGGNPDDFTGFEYMYAEVLRTESEENEETGEMESKELTVMIPKDDYSYVNRDYASVESLGVSFNVSLNPYFQYKQEDYLLYENLQALLDSDYDAFYSTDLKDLVVSEVEEIGDDAVRATVSYVEKNWDDQYVPYYKVYYAKEVEKDLSVLVEIEISLEDITGKTPMLLEEIEAFYEFAIEWDQAAMEEKVAKFLANDTGDVETFSTGSIIFELPKGWEEDYDFSDNYSAYTYAPGGDGEFAECAISIEKEYTFGEDYNVEAFLLDPEATKAMFAEEMGDMATNIELVDMGETTLGRTVKLTMDVEEEGILAHYAFYFASTDNYLFSIYAIQTDNATDDAFAAAEMVLATAQVRE